MTKTKKRHFSRWLLMPATLLYMEIVIRITCCGRFFGIGWAVMPIYTAVFGVVITVLCGFLGDKGNRRALIAVQSVLSVWYCTQIIYHSFFGKFLILYSIGAGGTDQIIGSGLVKNTMGAILSCWWAFVVLALPIVGVVLYTKYFEMPKIGLKKQGIILGSALLGYLVTFGIGMAVPSLREISIDAFNTDLCVKAFGLFRTELLDFRCNVLGWGGNGVIETVGPIDPIPEPEPEYKNQVMDIDFSALAGMEQDNNIDTLHEYFASQQPTRQNEYTGKFKGYNLIQITAEGFSPYAIDKNLTPTLYKMQHEGFDFTNFYTPIWEVSTSDGEYAATTGLIPKSGVWSYYRAGEKGMHLPFTMSQQFLNDGVDTVRAYHNHTYSYYHRDISHTNLGFVYKGLGNGLEQFVKPCWPESDLEMIEGTAEDYIGDERFMTYYMTVSGHLDYSFYDNSMAKKNKDLVSGLPYSDTVRAYYACNIELDRAMEALLAKLEAAGVADKTVIVITPDHYPYGLEDTESDNMYHYFDEIAGHSIDPAFELYKSCLIVYCPSMEPVQVDKYCSSLDILPTLNNLFGFEYDSRLLVGSDILSDSSPLVVFMDRSWITEKGKYNASDAEFIPFAGQTVDEEYVATVKKIVSNKFKVSAQILDSDYYGKVVPRERLQSK